MIMAKNSNNNYVNIEDIEAKNNNEYQDIEKIVSKQGNLLYNKYKEIENIPPITFKGKGKNLKNYRIYGNTVGGESVGDRTGNLFDSNINVISGYLSDEGILKPAAESRQITFDYIPIISGTYTFTYTVPLAYDLWVGVCTYDESRTFQSRLVSNYSGTATFTIPDTTKYIRISLRGYNKTPIIMLNEGSTALPYEPYGYKVPVTVEGKNLWSSGVEQGAVSQLGDYVAFSTRIRSKNIPLEPGTYKLTSNLLVRVIYAFNDNTKFDVVLTTAEGVMNPTFTVPEGANNVSIGMTKRIDGVEVDITPEDFEYGQIEKGSEATPYEPYHAPVTTPIYLPEQIRKVGNEAEYVDYETQKWHRVRKNLLKITLASSGVTTYDGVSISNNDGILTLNGTSNNGSFVNLATAIKLPIGNYILTGGSENLMLRFQKKSTSYGFDDTGTGRNIVCPEEVISGVCAVKLTANYTYNNIKVYPMIRKADIVDDTYEPYIENTEVDVTLPALPTIKGTNVLSVGTAVQPSKVYLKGKLKRTIYGWHVDPDISDSSNAVTYLKDAIGMTPASMGSSTFDYGSWENAFFMPKPCMLKSNGKVDYYLDPNDYTKKLDGTASDISNPNYDGNAMMQWPKIWFKYVKGVKEGQGYFYVANYKADGNYHCWCNYDSEDNEIDHFYTAIYNGTSFMDYSASKTYVVNDFAIYDNKLYKCNTNIIEKSFDNTKWDLVSNTAPVINKMRSLSGVRLTNNNGNAQTNTTTEVTRATANNITSAAEWYIETFSDRLLINGLLVLMGKSLNTQAVFGRGLDTGGQSTKEAYVTGTLNNKGLFWGVTENGNSGVKVFGMENFWGCCWHRTAGLIINNQAAVKLKLTYGTKDGSTVIGYNQTGNGYIDNGTAPYSSGYVQKMSYNKYGFMPAVVTGGSRLTYYADYHFQYANYAGPICTLFGGCSDSGLGAGAFDLFLNDVLGGARWLFAASLSCKPLL